MARKAAGNQVLVGFMLYEFATEEEADRFLACLKTAELATCESEVRPISSMKIQPDPSSDTPL